MSDIMDPVERAKQIAQSLSLGGNNGGNFMY